LDTPRTVPDRESNNFCPLPDDAHGGVPGPGESAPLALILALHITMEFGIL